MKQTLILDRDWRFLPGDGTVEAITTHADSYSSSKAGSERGIPSMNYDDSAWRVVNVPHDYLTETDFREENLISHGYKTRHNAWYRKTFCLPAEYAGKHLLLSFEGMAVTARVYLNGSLVGRSFSAYAPLDIDITDRAFFGDRPNVLVVYIDGLSTEGWWYEGAGIYRHVMLYVKDQIHMAHDSVFFKPTLCEGTENDWSVRCEATVENTGYIAGARRIKAEIFDGDTLVAEGISDWVTAKEDSRITASVSLSVKDPSRWDVDNPKLYRAKMTLLQNDEAVETEETRIGFRTFTADKDLGFFLNGKPIKLKGTCNHQDHAGVGVAVPDSLQYYRVRRLKEMGTNAYRCSHNMPAKAILDACDEYGLLVMDENRRFEARPEVIGHVESMVRRDRNHPSVVMYSLFNEEPMQGTKEGGQIFRRMKQAVLRLDDSRIVTGAMNGGYNDPEGAAVYMDATGINYALPDGILKYRSLYPDQPVFGAENNSAVTTRGCYKTSKEDHVLACYDEETVPWGQLIKNTWKFTRERDWFGGIFIWTGFDYRGEPTPYIWPSIGSQFGIMDTCGFPKDSFYQNNACFVDEPILHILPHWEWQEGDEVRVMTASNCDEVELFLNGTSLGRKPSDACAPAEWQVTFVPGELSAVGYRNGEAVITAKNVTPGKPAHIKVEPDRAYLYNDGADTIPVNVSLTDEDGNTIETANQMLYFEIIGDGVLLGVGNGDPNCLESDHEPKRSLFAGHAQLIVQSDVGAKSLAIRVSGDGLPDTVCEIEIRDTDKPAYVYAAANTLVDGVTVTTETYREMPDACMEIADNDMNSLEPVSFDGWNCKPGFTDGWKFFRAKINIPGTQNPDFDNTAQLCIGHIRAAAVTVYMDSVKVYEGGAVDGELNIPFACESGTTCEMRLLLRADSKPAGIISGIKLLVK